MARFLTDPFEGKTGEWPHDGQSSDFSECFYYDARGAKILLHLFFESGTESNKEGDARDQQEKKRTHFIESSPGILNKGMEIEERDPSREL